LTTGGLKKITFQKIPF